MFSQRFKISVFLVIAAFLISQSVIHARSSGDKPEQAKGCDSKVKDEWHEMCKDLGLTNQQKLQLEESRNNHEKRMKTLFGQIKEKGSLIDQELEKDQLNIGKVNQLNGEIKQLQAQMSDLKLQGMLEMRRILTPEQFKKFMANTEKKRGHFKNKGKKSK